MSDHLNCDANGEPWMPGPDEHYAELGLTFAGTRAAIYWLGHLANRVDSYLKLPRPEPETPAWDGLDSAGRERFAADFDHILAIDRAIQASFEWGGWYSHMLPRNVERNLRDTAEIYRGYLPLSYVELQFLENQYYDINLQTAQVSDDYCSKVGALRDELLPGGQRAAEVIDRWWDWRRGVGEFSVNSDGRFMRELGDLGEQLGGAWIDGNWAERLEV